ncbi:hypothetical protein HGRIS_005438 [Hohenbuehelia grisea]|uniref:HAM1-like N-terminal domain-containing protein n=1 Tax=Hohenbuehelia grisea TaxID=104357 RepID=A0ABR3JXU8_9AGAR
MSSTPSFDLGHRKEQLLDLLLFVLLLLLSQHTADDIIQDFVHQTRRCVQPFGEVSSLDKVKVTGDRYAEILDADVAGYGPLSEQGRKVVHDMRHVVHAAKAFAVDKNTDHTIQDFIYSTRHVRPVPVCIDADETLDALDQRISSAKAKAPEPPTELDLAHDVFALIDSLKSLAHFLTMSSAFCLILSDILTTACQLVAEGAAQATTFAHEVEVAADNVKKVSQFGDALLTILSILTKYTTTLRASANLLSEAPMSPRTISAIPCLPSTSAWP